MQETIAGHSVLLILLLLVHRLGQNLLPLLCMLLLLVLGVVATRPPLQLLPPRDLQRLSLRGWAPPRRACETLEHLPSGLGFPAQQLPFVVAFGSSTARGRGGGDGCRHFVVIVVGGVVVVAAEARRAVVVVVVVVRTRAAGMGGAEACVLVDGAVAGDCFA